MTAACLNCGLEAPVEHRKALALLRTHLTRDPLVPQFSEGKVAPQGARIVYIDGAFDLFHPGHVEILKVI